MKLFRTLVLATLLGAMSRPAMPHSGGTNGDGCHTDHRTGDYHCHTPKTPPPGAVTRSSALSWDRRTSEALMHRWPVIAMNALVLLGQELEAMRKRYRELATERVEQRVARALLQLVREAGAQTKRGWLIEMPLSRQDLAELAGTTLHTASRIMSAWEERHLVESGRQRVLVRDPDALAALAGDGPYESSSAP